MKRLLLLAALIGLTSCVTSPQIQVVPRIPINAAEYAALPTSGTGVVRGQLFAKQRGGGVVKGAGSEIILNPVTSLSQQWYDEFKKGNAVSSDVDPRYNAAIRTVRADADGRFEFRNVPPGEYFVNGTVQWEVPTLGVQGGRPVERVKVQNENTTDVILAL